MPQLYMIHMYGRKRETMKPPTRQGWGLLSAGQRLSVGGQTLEPGRHAVPGTDGVIEVVSAPDDDLD